METATDRRWIVQGRLVGPWVSELRTTWKRAHKSQDKRACIIDLNDVTFIDKSGERLLRAMCKKGAQLIARGLYVKHVLEQVKVIGANATGFSVDRTVTAPPSFPKTISLDNSAAAPDLGGVEGSVPGGVPGGELGGSLGGVLGG